MRTALVLSAGGMFAAWEAGVWIALHRCLQPDLIVGASAGAWNGWLIAAGATPKELVHEWLDPHVPKIVGNPRRTEDLCKKARQLFERHQPRIPFALTVTEIPSLRPRLVSGSDITWQHLAATCSIPFLFPPVEIDGGKEKRYRDRKSTRLNSSHVS